MAGSSRGRSPKVPWYISVYQWSLKNKELFALIVLVVLAIILIIFGG